MPEKLLQLCNKLREEIIWCKVPPTSHKLSRFTRTKFSPVTLLTNGKMELNVEKCEVIDLKAGNQTGEYLLNRASIQQRDQERDLVGRGS